MFSQRVVVALDTDQGVVYAPAVGWDRLFLVWTFRNFRSLAQNVLSPRQQNKIGSLYRAASNCRSAELYDAVVVGTVEGFKPSALPTSVEVRKPAAAEKKSPDVPTFVSKPLYIRSAFNPMALKVSTAAVVLVIAILAWHQLGARPIVNATSAETAVTACQPLEPIASARDGTPRDLPQKNSRPASVDPASNPAVAAPLASTNSNTETTSAHLETATPAAQRSAASLARSAPQTIATMPPHRRATVSKPNEAMVNIHHPVPAPAIISEDQPRIQISGRPRKLVFPVCPETQARGKVSLHSTLSRTMPSMRSSSLRRNSE